MKANANGIDIEYAVDEPEDAPVVVMSHSPASSHRMWDSQPALADYRVHRFDTRGHGGSDALVLCYTNRLNYMFIDASAPIRARARLILARISSPAACHR